MKKHLNRSNKGCPSCSEQDLEKLGNRNIACDPQIIEPKITLRPIVNSIGQQLYDIQMNGSALPPQIKRVQFTPTESDKKPTVKPDPSQEFLKSGKKGWFIRNEDGTYTHHYEQ